jgi:N-ethylmaleimide reductase
MPTLFEPITLGDLTLPNRLAMAPMTRDRAGADGTPTELNAQYYAQRATVGLIISEATQPSDEGQGYILTPGIYTTAHVAGWKRVTDAVHQAGGRIFVQIMHVGRIAHPENTLHGTQSVAPSAVKPNGQMFTMKGPQDMPEPRALTTKEIIAIIADYRHAARCAVDAGADGIEIHGANGYLVHQFLGDTTNVRTDVYGGSVENKIRFAVEIAKAVAEEIGAQRVGFRISPGNPFNDMSEKNSAQIYPALIEALGALNLAYLHVVHIGDEPLLDALRAGWPNVLIVNRVGRPVEKIGTDVADGRADIASIGTFALANPDLVARLKSGEPLNPADPSTFYGGNEKGYTDYPTIDAVVGAAR